MAGQTERLLARARDRFTVQDYYGAIYLLEEIVASGRAFADVHHLIGVSLSLLGRSEEALGQFGRALERVRLLPELLTHGGSTGRKGAGRRRPVAIALARHRALAADVEGGQGIQLPGVRNASDHPELLRHSRIGGRRLHAPEFEGRPRVAVEIGQDR